MYSHSIFNLVYFHLKQTNYSLWLTSAFWCDEPARGGSDQRIADERLKRMLKGTYESVIR